jgi:hypothetical protein
MRYVWGIAIFVLVLFSADFVGLIDVSEMSSTQLWGIMFLMLAILLVLKPDKAAKVDASADKWRHFRAERDKPDPALTLKMLILTVVGSMLLLGPVLVLAAGVVFVIVLVIAGISHG